MEKKKKYIGIALATAAVLIGTFVVSNINWGNRNSDQIGEVEIKTEVNSDSNPEKAESSSDNSMDKNDKTNPEISENGDFENESSATGFEWMERLAQYERAEKNADSATQIDSTTREKIGFPYSIPGTDLVIENIAGYSGVYVEDRSDADTENVAAILISNTGSKDVEFCSISLTGNSGDFTFTGSAIPAGSHVVIMADGQKGYSGSDFESVGGAVSNETDLGMSASEVEVVSTDEGKITIKNVAGRDLPTVRVFYKFYLPEQDALIGGITYNSKVNNLKSGETVTLEPSHFAGDHSKIVMIRTYDEEN